MADFPSSKQSLTNRLFSNHRGEFGALTGDSPAAAAAGAKKQNVRGMGSSLNGGLSSLGQPTSYRSRRLSASASARTLLNSRIPPRKGRHASGTYRGRFASGAQAWDAPGAIQAGPSFAQSIDADSLLQAHSTVSKVSTAVSADSDDIDHRTPKSQAETKQGAAFKSDGSENDETRPPTFTESLQLDEHYLEEFLGGNFVYLRPKAGLQRTAYDLECVEHFETDPMDYYTMSKEGITHFCKSSESEFTPLDKWEEEYSMFHKIRKIVFFRRYRLWKSFTVWMRSFRKRKMDLAAKEIQSRLPMFTPALQHTHSQIVHLCHDLSEWQLFALNPELCSTLEEFVLAQDLQRTQVSDWMVGFSDDIRLLVRNACDDVLDAFLEANEIRAQHRMTFMEKAALRTECARLVKYIRVVDILVVGTLRQLALESLQKFCDYVSPTTRYDDETQKSYVIIALLSKWNLLWKIFKGLFVERC